MTQNDEVNIENFFKFIFDELFDTFNKLMDEFNKLRLKNKELKKINLSVIKKKFFS